jgi:hypothetical protein
MGFRQDNETLRAKVGASVMNQAQVLPADKDIEITQTQHGECLGKLSRTAYPHQKVFSTGSTG